MITAHTAVPKEQNSAGVKLGQSGARGASNYLLHNVVAKGGTFDKVSPDSFDKWRPQIQ